MNNKKYKNAINQAIEDGVRFFFYRLPNTDTFSFGVQSNDAFVSPTGFCIKPFVESEKSVAVKIYVEYGIDEYLQGGHKCGKSLQSDCSDISTSYEDYIKTAEQTVHLFETGVLQKMVLSRILVQPCGQNSIDWGAVAITLTQKYPQAFVFAFYTPETGAWMGASPEILGRYHDSVFSTMALAGTKPTGIGEWSEKEKTEQEYVASYISEIIERCGFKYKMSGKYTRGAGNVEHLCNDFLVDVPSLADAMSLVGLLHPTPALAGIPKDCAICSIQQIERHSRKYYGGYLGPFTADGFDFFVNLRSMSFSSESYTLYIGGGLTIDSVPEKEWNETRHKAQTLLNVINDYTDKKI